MNPKPAKSGRPSLGKAKRLRLSMTLKPELVDQIDKRASREGVSASRLVESLIEEGLRLGSQKRNLALVRLGVEASQLKALCRALGLKRLALFGSALTDKFGPESDVDLLVEFLPGTVVDLLDRGRIQMEFEGFFGRRVDLAELRLIDNPIRRREIASKQQEIYAA